MGIRDVPLVNDLRIYQFKNVSKEHGRKRLTELESKGLIRPTATPTGRKLLSIRDAEALAEAL
jgi:hypothetical protein